MSEWGQCVTHHICDCKEAEVRQRERQAAEYLNYLRNIYEAINGEGAWTPSALSIYNDTLNFIESCRRDREGEGEGEG